MRRSGRTPLLVGTLAAALFAAGCVSSSDIDSLGAQISELQRQLLQVQMQAPSKLEVTSLEDRVSGQMDLLLKSEADMQVRLQELSSQIEQLQANLEDTNYRLAQLSQAIAATNQELKAVRTAPPPVPAPVLAEPGTDPGTGGAPVQRPVIPTDPESLYQTAYNDYLRGNYDLAIREFQEYLTNFPDTELTDNAVYWTGEAYYRQRKFRQAIQQFDTVLNRYPRSDKLPSAALKKGYAHLELGERSQGVVQLQYVVRQYPGSDEANLARARLRELER
ncbi:MAG TPA: tol-pal system protein YbgF [Thermoanaerobaculia bacterium]|nr:tol-pal system protein YbgF [Thermoanaerobaculia bacterium]